jgi:tetratricopeptide (TPR) repeat protein
MLSTKLYKRVHSLAEGLLKAAHKEDEVTFDALYQELNVLCDEHENTEKNHPVQWETLADFTDESDDALALYEKALGIAEAESAHDYIASINYAMAVLLKELGENEQALTAAKNANAQSGNISDEELKEEITNLIEALEPPPAPEPHPIYG